MQLRKIWINTGLLWPTKAIDTVLTLAQRIMGTQVAMLHMTVACIQKKLFWGSCQHFVRYLGCLAAVAELPHNLFHVCLGIALRNSVANLLPNVRRNGRCAGSATLHYVFLLLFSIEWLYECVFIFIALQQMMLQRLWTLTARICSHKLCNIMCMNPSRNFA